MWWNGETIQVSCFFLQAMLRRHNTFQYEFLILWSGNRVPLLGSKISSEKQEHIFYICVLKDNMCITDLFLLSLCLQVQLLARCKANYSSKCTNWATFLFFCSKDQKIAYFCKDALKFCQNRTHHIAVNFFIAYSNTLMHILWQFLPNLRWSSWKLANLFILYRFACTTIQYVDIKWVTGIPTFSPHLNSRPPIMLK